MHLVPQSPTAPGFTMEAAARPAARPLEPASVDEDWSARLPA